MSSLLDDIEEAKTKLIQTGAKPYGIIMSKDSYQKLVKLCVHMMTPLKASETVISNQKIKILSNLHVSTLPSCPKNSIYIMQKKDYEKAIKPE